jgi:glycosyltransferase involved in cell wall biosynthesis
VDAVVGVSKFILERHLKFGYFATTPHRRVIYNPMLVESAAPSSRTASLPIRFGYLGRLHPTKGIEVLLESVKQLPKGTWSLDIGGKGLCDYESYLHDKYKIPSVRFLGHVAPESLFSRIDTLVVPSTWHDPAPTVIKQAHANGVPVIGSKRGGIPELVEDSQTGFLFDPSYPSDLMLKMQRIINKPVMIDDMKSDSLRTAKSTSPDVIEQYLEVYSEVMGGA